MALRFVDAMPESVGEKAEKGEGAGKQIEKRENCSPLHCHSYTE
jgi:hypothetical protein